MRNSQAIALQQLLTELNLNSTDSQVINDNAFVFKAPQHFISQIDSNRLDDPLLKQVLPVQAENLSVTGYQQDPVADLEFNATPSLIHKYHGRALMIASPKCDIHCRYCFRRHFPYQQQVNQRHWQQAINYLQNDNTINELILSGGDPMSLGETALIRLIEMAEQVKHLKTLRIHSRTPVVAPDKAPQQAFLEWAQQTSLKVVLVVHCNHAQELSKQSADLFRKYQQAGITLLNQSVLLKGVNDDTEVLEQLSHGLFQQGILPYYLNQLDKVEGAAHFQVEDAEAIKIHQQLRGRLPGYLLPRLVQDIVGKSSKTQLA